MPLRGRILGKFGSYRGIVGKLRAEGIVAWGEMSISMERFWVLSKDFRNYLEEELLGKGIVELLRSVYESEIPFSSLLESMFLDAIGKKAGVPWNELYGKVKDKSDVVYLTFAEGSEPEEGIGGAFLLASSGEEEKDRLALSSLEDLGLIFYWPSERIDIKEMLEYDFYLVSEKPNLKNLEVPMINRLNYFSFLHPKLLGETSEYYDYAILDISSLGILRSMRIGNLLEALGISPIFYPGLSTSILNSLAFRLSTLFDSGKFVLTSHVLYEDVARPCFEVEEGIAYDLGNPGNGAMVSKTILAKYSGHRWGT